MAKKKKEAKELTHEEKMLQEKERGLKEIERVLPYLSTPSYHFQVGDKVMYGAMKESTVEEVLYDNKVYVLRCIATNNNYGHPYDYETYRVASWVRVRPLPVGRDSIAKNQEVRIHFNNSTIESLLSRYYNFGIDMEPEYQRGYVWSQKDKELLIDSIFNNIEIGRFALINKEDWLNTGFSYEILDGKQRLSALLEFYENRFPYNGKYFNDLVPYDQSVFKNHNIAIGEIENCSKNEVLRYFLMVNRTGKSMDENQLEKVKEMLKTLQGENHERENRLD